MKFNKIFFLLLIVICNSLFLFSQTNKDSLYRVLIVTAHPDDESAFAVAVYKVTHELKGIVDLAVITNGEAGYKYSSLAEPYYNLKLTDEAIGRKYLPTIRKKELMAAGNIIGISNYFFLDQQDNHYTLDVDTVFNQVWDIPLIKKRLRKIIETGNYDFIFCLLPTSGTHGHHKGAAILALQTLSEMGSGKPVILAGTTSDKSDTSTIVFTELEKFPITKISSGKSSFVVDRTVSFGFKNKLSYKIIVNWEIAEHKSQGTVQSYTDVSDIENFWYFDLNDPAKKNNTEKFFEKLNGFRYAPVTY